jgi:hypothetical protein
MAKTYSDLLQEVKSEVRIVSLEETKRRLEANEGYLFVDVREKDEQRQGFIPGAVLLPRGFLEMQAEQRLPDKHAKIVAYCAGGVRAVFAACQRMHGQIYAGPDARRHHLPRRSVLEPALRLRPGDGDAARLPTGHRLGRPDRLALPRHLPAVSPAAAGGHTLLADGAAVLGTLRRVHPLTAISQLRLRTTSGDTVPILVVQEALARIRFRDDPVATPWTDGERGVVAVLRKSILAATRPLPLSAGDGYVLHNHRYLHGRSSFAGHRQLARMLATVTCARLSWLNQGFRVADA